MTVVRLHQWTTLHLEAARHTHQGIGPPEINRDKHNQTAVASPAVDRAGLDRGVHCLQRHRMV